MSCLVLVKINKIKNRWNYLERREETFHSNPKLYILFINTWNLIFNRKKIDWKISILSTILIFIKKRIVIVRIVHVRGRKEEGKRRWDRGEKSLLTTIVFSWNWTVAIFHSPPLSLPKLIFSRGVLSPETLHPWNLFHGFSNSILWDRSFRDLESVIARIDPKIDRLEKVNPSRRKWNLFFFF